jgi:hypothetical protein
LAWKLEVAGPVREPRVRECVKSRAV